LALQLPGLFLLLGFGGALGSLVAAARRDVAPNRRAELAWIALAALLPVIVTVLARPAMYNGIRHFVFLLPPLAVLGGLAGAWLLERARPRAAVTALAAGLFAIGIASPVIEMIRLHPYAYTQVELGPDFEITWDPIEADFALMLGEFYCRRFDAPLWVEVARAGAVYARVYDIRGRSYDTLLTQPGLPSL